MIGRSGRARGDVPDHPEGQRLDRRPAQAADVVGEDRPAAPPVDGHAAEGVDQADGVGPAVAPRRGRWRRCR